MPNQWTDITVRHTGYADRELRSRKLDRDLRILNEQLAERPDDPFTLFNLGAIGVEHGRSDDALGYLKRSLAHSAPTDSITRKLFTLIAPCYQMLGDFPSALKCCVEGLSLDPGVRSYGSAKRWCTARPASRPRPSNAGGGS